MAEFNIRQQHARIIQQAEVINVGAATWDEVSEQLRTLIHDVKGLTADGKLDHQTGTELCAVISEAATAREKKSRLRALANASNLAAGVPTLSGVGQTIGQIMQATPL